MWNAQYQKENNGGINPELFADEYISTDECGRRLNVSDQTIRNWIAVGRATPDKGWKEGVHYVNVMFDSSKRAVIRIPWNALIQSFASNRAIRLDDTYGQTTMYRINPHALKD